MAAAPPPPTMISLAYVLVDSRRFGHNVENLMLLQEQTQIIQDMRPRYQNVTMPNTLQAYNQVHPVIQAMRYRLLTFVQTDDCIQLVGRLDGLLGLPHP